MWVNVLRVKDYCVCERTTCNWFNICIQYMHSNVNVTYTGALRLILLSSPANRSLHGDPRYCFDPRREWLYCWSLSRGASRHLGSLKASRAEADKKMCWHRYRHPEVVGFRSVLQLSNINTYMICFVLSILFLAPVLSLTFFFFNYTFFTVYIESIFKSLNGV